MTNGKEYDKKWLRKFLQLGRDAKIDGIPPKEIERQEDTVLRALKILDEQPGVILADEVGMGKTFEAIAIMACFLKRGAKGRILVITPGPDLNTHWMSVMDRFRERGFYTFKKGQYVAINRIGELPKVTKSKKVKIIFAPISIFITVRGIEEKAFLMNAFFRWSKLSRKKRERICKLYFGTIKKVQDVTKMKPYMGLWRYSDIKPVLDEAFRRTPHKGGDGPVGFEGLADILESSGESGFKDNDRVRNAISRARFKIVNGKIPDFSLLIVDEAHKLKNPWAVRSQAFDTILFDKFKKAVFLTATPFQLDVDELYQVFKLFSYAKLGSKEREEFNDSIQKLRESIEEYQRTYEELEETWVYMDTEKTEQFEQWYSQNPDLGGSLPASREVEALVLVLRRLLKMKREHIEPGFSSWMIRSLKEEKHEYRLPLRVDVPERNTSLAFLVHERLIYEMYRSKNRTYKAAVEISMTSSFEAARNGAVLALKAGSKQKELKEYRDLLRRLLGLKSVTRNHPKVSYVAEQACEALLEGKKTLVFCDRVHTARALADQCDTFWKEHINELWRGAMPGVDDKEIGKQQRNYQKYFTTATNAYSVLMSENYIPALLGNSGFVKKNRKEIVSMANALLGNLRLSGTSIRNVNYRVAKRCLEHSALRLVMEQRLDSLSRLTGHRKELAERILEKDYVISGMDRVLETDASISWKGGSGKKPIWEIPPQLATTVLTTSNKGLWHSMRVDLGKLSPEVRMEFVDAVRSFLTKQQVEFLPVLLKKARQRGGGKFTIRTVRAALDEWWNGGDCDWRERTEALLQLCIHMNESERTLVLENGLRSSSPVRHTLEASSRLGLKEGFNTPFYPMVLICNTPMQEGLDLHKECTRLVHHDLCWNPAQLEQRVGRLDRIGSKINQLRESDPDAMLELYYPLIPKTIDVHQYEVVKEREKWLEFLLGRPPEFDYDPMEEVDLRQLPEGIKKELTINLSPAGNRMQ